MSRTGLLALTVSTLALIAAGAAQAQSVAYTAPNFANTLDPVSVSLGGSTFVNQGLVGTIRLPANLHDFNGETLGSFSGMAIDLSTWRRAADGSYSTTLFTLPDRGPNNIGGFTTTNYAARLNRFTFTLNPYTGTSAVASNVQQGTLTQSGGFLLRDSTGQVFTGRDPQAGVVVRDGITYPTPPAGDAGAGKIALDAEAVTFLSDGSFYVSDEYQAAILYFDASGKQIGAIQANPDLLPRVNGQINFNGTNDAPLVPGSTGRRSNQGLEGLSVSPDGKRLFAVLQSATLQDNPTNVAARRNNTRVLIYDIGANRTPTAPVAEYVLQLPVFNNSATGTGTANATAAQSEVLALNNTQFLVLSRDGNGRGTNGNANQIAFKSVLLVDIAGATNIAGTPYSTGTNPTPISTTAAANGSGALVAGIVPVQQVELVNMLNTAQLTKFGVNTRTNPSVQYTLSEKWEAMGLAPVLDESKPHDFFLLIGNDNDFVSDDIDAAGVTNANAALNSATAGVGNNDNVIMVYRLTLPTYIDPQALAFLQGAAPLAMSATRTVSARLGAAPMLAGQQSLSDTRHAVAAGVEVDGWRGWAQGSFDRVATPRDVTRVDAGGFSLGVEGGSSTLRYGLAVSGSKYDSDGDDGFDLDGESYAASLFAAVLSPTGFWAQGAVGVGKVDMDVSRPAAYGLIATGKAKGETFGLDVQAGYAFDLGTAKVGPYAEALFSSVQLDSYREHGAAVGNGEIPNSDFESSEATLGLEATFTGWGGVRPTARIGYTWVREGGDEVATLALSDLPNSADNIRLPGGEDDFVSVELGIEGEVSGFGWRAGVTARDTEGRASGGGWIGITKRF
jgi:uncharacterized protein YhjY with autotransporter beta-barrel domain